METLIIRMLQGRASPSEKERLRRWIQADPDNYREYERIRETWWLAGLGAAVTEEVPDGADLIELAEAGGGLTAGGRPGDRKAHELKEPGVPEPMRSGVASGPGLGPWGLKGSKFRRGALAASLVAIGFGIAYLGGQMMGEPATPLTNEVRTGPGEITTVTLSDGSSVRLGPRSELRISEGADEQRLQLEGRAFFGVDHDPSRSFVVETRYGDAVALGTRFEVRTEEDDFRVLVVDGRVSVSVADVELEVAGGEMSRTSPGMRPSKMTVSDIYEHLDWMGNHLAFRATPLGQAAHELERRYGVTVSIERPELQTFPVTATFTGESVENVILVLCEIAGVECELGKDQFRIGTQLPNSVSFSAGTGEIETSPAAVPRPGQ